MEIPCAHLRVSLIVTCGIAKRLEFAAGLETEELEDEHWSVDTLFSTSDFRSFVHLSKSTLYKNKMEGNEERLRM